MGMESIAKIGFGVIILDSYKKGPWIDEFGEGDEYIPIFEWIASKGLDMKNFDICSAGREYGTNECSHLFYTPASVDGFQYWTEFDIQEIAAKEEEARQAFAKLFTGNEEYIEQGPNWILSHRIG